MRFTSRQTRVVSHKCRGAIKNARVSHYACRAILQGTYYARWMFTCRPRDKRGFSEFLLENSTITITTTNTLAATPRRTAHQYAPRTSHSFAIAADRRSTTSSVRLPRISRHVLRFFFWKKEKKYDALTSRAQKRAHETTVRLHVLFVARVASRHRKNLCHKAHHASDVLRRACSRFVASRHRHRLSPMLPKFVARLTLRVVDRRYVMMALARYVTRKRGSTTIHTNVSIYTI